MIHLKQIKNNILNSYDKIHRYLELDNDCLEGSMVSDSFISAFKGGPKELFAGLEMHQPLTFKALSCCNDLWLLESKRPGYKGSMFTLAVVYDEHIITSQMLNKRLLGRRQKEGEILPSSMLSLNKELRGYYSLFNGLNNPRSRSAVGLRNYDLPLALGQWDEIMEYCEEYGIDKNLFKGVVDKAGNQLLVWIVNDNGMFYLIDESEENNSIYRVDINGHGDYNLLQDPIREIDEYCSSIIRKTKCNLI